MDLTEEYIVRHKIESPVIRYRDNASLLLKSKIKKDHWLNFNSRIRVEPNKPPCFMINLYSSSPNNAPNDFGFVSSFNKNLIIDEVWQWDEYEMKLMAWISGIYKEYMALNKQELIPSMWSLFVSSNDRWLSNFLPINLYDDLKKSFVDSNEDSVKKIEIWLKECHERVYNAWNKMKNEFGINDYSDWLIQFVNKK